MSLQEIWVKNNVEHPFMNQSVIPPCAELWVFFFLCNILQS